MDHPTTNPDYAVQPAPDNRRWWFVHASIVAAFLLFFVFVALLYINWLRTDEPESILTIPRGTDARAGMVVQVEGWNLDKPLQLELTPENGYGGRIYLSPGVYTLKLLRDGEVLRDYGEVNVLQFRELTVPILEGQPEGPYSP